MINLDKTVIKRISRFDLIRQNYDKDYEVRRIYVPVDEKKQIESIVDVFVANHRLERGHSHG